MLRLSALAEVAPARVTQLRATIALCLYSKAYIAVPMDGPWRYKEKVRGEWRVESKTRSLNIVESYTSKNRVLRSLLAAAHVTVAPILLNTISSSPLCHFRGQQWIKAWHKEAPAHVHAKSWCQRQKEAFQSFKPPHVNNDLLEGVLCWKSMVSPVLL